MSDFIFDKYWKEESKIQLLSARPHERLIAKSWALWGYGLRKQKINQLEQVLIKVTDTMSIETLFDIGHNELVDLLREINERVRDEGVK